MDSPDDPKGPQSPAEPPPAPAPPAPAPPAPAPPAGPQSPAPGAHPPPPPPGPETLGQQQAPVPPQAPGYGGPVPPGGWHQPAVQQPAPVSQGQLASWGARLGALLIDGLVLAVPAVILFFVIVAGAVGISGADEDVATGAAIAAFLGWGLLVLVVYLLYAPVLMMRDGAHNGQTWGKQVLGIRAVRDNGRPYDFGSAALREIVLKGLAVFIASSIIPIIPWFLNYFWPLWDDQNRALHDMAASSHVVRA